VKDAEHRFLSRIFADGSDAVTEAVELGITTDHFADPELGQVWDYVADYADQHSMLPSVNDVQFQVDTDWEPDEPEDALGRLVELLKQARSYGLFTDVLGEARKLVKSDPAAAWALVGQGYEQASAEKGVLKPLNVHDNWVDWLTGYWTNSELKGIPTGFPTIDYATGGYQPEQLITIVGPPKAGKSTLMLKLAHYANVAYGKRVYMATFEMSAEEQRRRLACMEAEVDYEKFLQRKLSPREIKRMERTLSRLEEVTPDFIIASDITAGSTVGAITAQIRKYDPAVVFIDGVYLMDAEVPDASSMDPKSLTALTRNLKRAAQRTGKPIVITHQVLESRYSKKAGIRSKDIGYSSSFAQDSDVIFGVETTDNPAERRMSIVMARNAAPRSTVLGWDWTTSTMEEIEGYSSADSDDEDFDFDDHQARQAEADDDDD
jgi:KaiC/GvpD/RAD55 family RecA-like ATPase